MHRKSIVSYTPAVRGDFCRERVSFLIVSAGKPSQQFRRDEFVPLAVWMIALRHQRVEFAPARDEFLELREAVNETEMISAAKCRIFVPLLIEPDHSGRTPSRRCPPSG